LALSDTLENANVVNAVSESLRHYGVPGIINSDQGSQFTSTQYRQLLNTHGITQSMDGKARWVDNVIIEHWFRSLKTEYVYINEYTSPAELRSGLKAYIDMYNHHRPHQNLDNRVPFEVYSKVFPPCLAM
jgi:putative transposase